MPEPPEVYNFKLALITRLPYKLQDHITMVRITAEDSSVNEIMQQALSVEKGWCANKFYSVPTASNTPKKMISYKNKDSACFACGKTGHFMNDPVYEKHVAGAPGLAAIVEEQFSEDDQEPQGRE
uniref:CCHC-type domain-containing protein n=1 Tax=Moniliophthora roreri TaxID=221103 RepID=A0A0W0FVZ5_MONRR